MGLQIWLPLNGNLENKGLSNITITNNGSTFNSMGKLGGCYNFDNSMGIITNNSITLNTTFSISCWVKVNSWNLNWANVFKIYKDAYDYIGLCMNQTSSTIKQLGFHIYKNNGSNTRVGVYDSYYMPLTLGEWYHLCFTVTPTEMKTYQNGDCIKTATIDSNFPSVSNYILSLGKNPLFYGLDCSINDFRIYDEVLSPMQIKLISQGLVAHYLLNRNGLGATNLLKNGFGELGAENWADASKMFDDVPSNHPEIYHSFRDVESVEYIPIYRNHTYQFSTWIKAPSSSGISYPGLRPYDADKNFIYYYNCTEGFNLSTMTTLTHELKTGDTKIYVSDLSAWNANSGHNYNYAALFGYTDGTGYTYPDGFYTRDLGIFGSGTSAKTNLDKTNNIITLNSAYTGANKPIGTKVCASTAGGTYYYPLGGINNTTITDWTYKEGTFSSEVPRLSAAKYVRVYAYSYQAGITLTDLTLLSTEDNIEYDVSGYCNNGIKYNITDYVTDSPRYSLATKFNGTNSYIDIGRGGMVRDEITVNVWGYLDDWTKYNGRRFISCTEGGGWNFESASNSIRFSIGTGDTSNTYVTGTLIPYTDLTAGWHMFTGIFDGFNNITYLDGNLVGVVEKYTTKTPVFYHKNNAILIGSEATSSHAPGGAYYNGNLSDVRIYATALSESDLQSLYNNSAFIDSSGNVYSTEYTES